jgi:lipopolysaccharide export system permease protein
MPLLWRYLLRKFLQIFVLSVSAFIGILLVTRFQNIARFASTGASILLLLKFVLVQIPHILPLAIPISCLISSFILFQRMSQSHELTALRVAGIGFGPIGFPLLLVGAITALVNFTIVSEISPRCRSYSKNLAYQMTAVNPFCLLQKGNVIKLKNAYIDMKLLKSGQSAEDVCLVIYNTNKQRLGLILAKKLSLEGDQLFGQDVTFVSSLDSKAPDAFDHLIVENQSEIQIQANHLFQYLISSTWSFNYDYLNYRLIQAKHAIEQDSSEGTHSRALQEMARRFSLALASLGFTFVGMASGFEIRKNHRIRGLFWATAFMTFYLVTFVTAKSLKHYPLVSLAVFALPHPILWIYCFYAFRRISRGR